MTSNPLDRYASMMNRTTAPESLPNQVMARIRSQESSSTQTKNAWTTHAQNAPGPTKRVHSTSVPTVSAKHSRFKSLAIAACTLLVVGAGILTVGPLASSLGPEENSGAGAPLPNMFGLAVAEAAEAGQRVQLAADESGITLAGSAGRDIRFAMNLTCTGESIRHLSYSIEGADVKFMSIDMSGEHPDVDTPESFDIDYNDQNPEKLHREILVNMADPAVIEIREKMTALGQQMDATDDPDEFDDLQAQWDALNRKYLELENAYYAGGMSGGDDSNTWFARKMSEAAQKLEQATLSITATFDDGSTTTKRYRIAPVEDFEQICKSRFDVESNPEHDEDDPRLTAPLFTITELL